MLVDAGPMGTGNVGVGVVADDDGFGRLDAGRGQDGGEHRRLRLADDQGRGARRLADRRHHGSGTGPEAGRRWIPGVGVGGDEARAGAEGGDRHGEPLIIELRVQPDDDRVDGGDRRGR